MGKLMYYYFFVLLISVGQGCTGKQESQERKPQGEVPDSWFRNAFIYNVEIGTFKDSDGDGMGDIKGLISKLGYLDSLGVDVIWLSPFQPSPGLDDGYDVSDYYSVNDKYGKMEDFEQLVAELKKRRIRVIMDIVLNHTSIEHPWFKAARADSAGKFHFWYVWADQKPKDWDKGMVFPGIENATWSFDNIAAKYYFHRFYAFQPDLNYQNMEVREQARKILLHWLEKGVDGFRLDAVPFIIDIPETGSADPEHMFDILTDLRRTIQSVNPEALMLGEANVTAEENQDYFGANADRLQMMFNFYANQYLFYAFASGKPGPFVAALEEFREKPAGAQWAFFLRNHDEIDLARLGKAERKKVYEEFGPETNMQLYDRGIRRRLAPMLADRSRLDMAYSLLFSLPGTPVIRYGEELGMGDDLGLRERLSVRTPMQWDSSANAGFSKGTKTFRPVISGGEFDYRKVNVQAELRDEGSLLNFVSKLAAVRKAHPEIGRGNWNAQTRESLMVIRYELEGRFLVALHNFGDQSITYQIGPTESYSRIISSQGVGEQKGSNIHIPPYGFIWYAFQQTSDAGQ